MFGGDGRLGGKEAEDKTKIFQVVNQQVGSSHGKMNMRRGSTPLKKKEK